MRYFTTPRWVQRIWPALLWRVKTDRKVLYLTFDDGPTDAVTPWILQTLEGYAAKGTFFCVGENVQRRPAMFAKLKETGHAVGNHTHNHLNTLKTPMRAWLENTALAAMYIDSTLFRPPYGMITPARARELKRQGYTIVMWDIISYDFDKDVDLDQAWNKIRIHAGPGSIIVFHDHTKAWENLKVLLPKTLLYFAEQGYAFEALPEHGGIA